ncbi:hypothetical protein DFH09DRAFT_1102648 [Mycena vulgaris]|nr:hypothetical protein DFH09DRAFT_1102648 [Mycena vulgaris]
MPRPQPQGPGFAVLTNARFVSFSADDTICVRRSASSSTLSSSPLPTPTPTPTRTHPPPPPSPRTITPQDSNAHEDAEKMALARQGPLRLPRSPLAVCARTDTSHFDNLDNFIRTAPATAATLELQFYLRGWKSRRAAQIKSPPALGFLRLSPGASQGLYKSERKRRAATALLSTGDSVIGLRSSSDFDLGGLVMCRLRGSGHSTRIHWLIGVKFGELRSPFERRGNQGFGPNRKISDPTMHIQTQISIMKGHQIRDKGNIFLVIVSPGARPIQLELNAYFPGIPIEMKSRYTCIPSKQPVTVPTRQQARRKLWVPIRRLHGQEVHNKLQPLEEHIARPKFRPFSAVFDPFQKNRRPGPNSRLMGLKITRVDSRRDYGGPLLRSALIHDASELGNPEFLTFGSALPLRVPVQRRDAPPSGSKRDHGKQLDRFSAGLIFPTTYVLASHMAKTKGARALGEASADRAEWWTCVDSPRTARVLPARTASPRTDARDTFGRGESNPVLSILADELNAVMGRGLDLRDKDISGPAELLIPSPASLKHCRFRSAFLLSDLVMGKSGSVQAQSHLSGLGKEIEHGCGIDILIPE